MANEFNSWSQPVLRWPAFGLALIISGFGVWCGWVFAGPGGYFWTAGVVTAFGVLLGLVLARRNRRLGASVVFGFLVAGFVELALAWVVASVPGS